MALISCISSAQFITDYHSKSRCSSGVRQCSHKHQSLAYYLNCDRHSSTNQYVKHVTTLEPGVCMQRTSLVQPPASAVKVALPTFADERRRALHGARSYWQPSTASRALSSKPSAAIAAVQRWDRQTDAGPWHRPCTTYYAGSFNYEAANH